MRQILCLLLLLVLSIYLSACAPADSSQSGVRKKTDVGVTIKITDNTGTVYINPDLGYTSDVGDQAMESAAVAEASQKFRLPLNVAQPGSQLNTDSMTEGATIEAILPGNPISAIGEPASAPDTDPTGGDDPADGNEGSGEDGDDPVSADPVTDETHRLDMNAKLAGGKSFEWMGKTGKEYSAPLVVTWPECNKGEGYTLVVPDPSVTYGPNGNPKDYNQSFYFCGTDFPVGAKENNQFRASVFAPPGCKATYALLNQPNN